MPSIPSHVLIFGATGNIGRFITNSIVKAKPNISKITVFTSANTVSSKASLINGWKSAGVSVLVGDITKASDVTDAYDGVDTVISCVGRGVLDQQRELIRLAEESQSVQWFFPSEYGTDIEHNSKSAAEKPHQMKLAVRKYVRDHTKRLKVTYIVVGPYFEMWVDEGPWVDQLGGLDIKKNTASVIGDGNGRIGFTTMEDTGNAVLAALRHPEASYGKALKVASFVASPNEVVAEFEKQLGRKLDVKSISQADLERSESEMWADGNPLATIATLRRIWATGGTLYDKWDNETVGLETQSLEAAVKEYIQQKGL